MTHNFTCKYSKFNNWCYSFEKAQAKQNINAPYLTTIQKLK
jgi:hypothetical protein